MNKFLNNREWLIANYIEKGLTLKELAHLAGIPNDNATTARRALIRAGLSVRSISEGKTGRTHKGSPKGQETRTKIRASKIGKPSTAYWSPEARQRMREIRLGENNPMRGAEAPNRNKEDYDSNPKIRQRRRMRRHKFNITTADYNRMLENQNGVCAICRQPESVVKFGRVQDLSIDHCHKTDEVRELLCHRCNALLGLALDDPNILQSAVIYLEKHQDRLYNKLRIIDNS